MKVIDMFLSVIMMVLTGVYKTIASVNNGIDIVHDKSELAKIVAKADTASDAQAKRKELQDKGVSEEILTALDSKIADIMKL